jgi:hypothetical protein
MYLQIFATWMLIYMSLGSILCMHTNTKTIKKILKKQRLSPTNNTLKTKTKPYSQKPTDIKNKKGHLHILWPRNDNNHKIIQEHKI